MEQFCKEHKPESLTREKILSCMGTPDITYEYIGNVAGRFTDLYQITGKDNLRLEIQTDEAGRVTGLYQSQSPCKCDLYPGPAPSSDSVKNSPETVMKTLSSSTPLEIGRLLQVFGKPDYK